MTQRAADAGLASFYLVDDFARRGPMVVLLTERRWTSFLKMKAGFPPTPFYSRPRRDTEPETHPNGHPWAWLYSPDDVLKDEGRFLPESELAELAEALKGALQDAKTRRDEERKLEEMAAEAAA